MSTSHAVAVAQAIDHVRAAAADRSTLRIRGAGSKAFYLAHEVGATWSTASLDGVLSYEPSELVITVGAGTPVADVEALLAQQRQCLPFEPPHFAWAGAPAAGTIGGMVAAGLAGPARANAGGVREYVLGLRLINGQGEHLTFGGQVMKNVAGYDVSRLMVGAMGSLGVITEVSLKVLPQAHAEATLTFALPQHEALEQLHRWGGEPLPLNASTWWDGILTVRLRGAVAAVESACARMCQSAAGSLLDPAEATAHWTAYRNQTAGFFTQPDRQAQALWRISVPQTAPVLDVPYAPLVEWHGGQRWVWAPLQAAAQLQTAARAVGGSASVFIAPLALSARAEGTLDTQSPVDPVTATIARRLKASFDPHGIFNPGLSLYANHPRS